LSILKKPLSIAPLAMILCGISLSAPPPASAVNPAPAPKHAQPMPAAAPPQAQTPPQAKALPQAKTKDEYKAYTDAAAVTGGAAMEKAAMDFAGRFPDSQLTVYLYSRALHEYQNENNPAKILETGRKIITYDPDNAVALVLTATVLTDSLSEKDADRPKKISEIRENCSRAQKSIAAGISPPGADPQQAKIVASTLQSMVHSALGILALKLSNDAEAEEHLKAATQVENIQPDAYVWYHLALAMDHQKEYPQALAAVNQALRYVGSNADLQKLATGERDRLAKLAPATPPPQPEPDKLPH